MSGERRDDQQLRLVQRRRFPKVHQPAERVERNRLFADRDFAPSMVTWSIAEAGRSCVMRVRENTSIAATAPRTSGKLPITDPGWSSRSRAVSANSRNGAKASHCA